MEKLSEAGGAVVRRTQYAPVRRRCRPIGGTLLCATFSPARQMSHHVDLLLIIESACAGVDETRDLSCAKQHMPARMYYYRYLHMLWSLRSY